MPARKKNNDSGLLLYKDKPLIRKGNILYYGNPQDKYIIMITENRTEMVNGLAVATDVTVSLQTNHTGGRGREKIIKQVEREGLYRALDIAVVWLEDALEEDQ